MNDHLTGNDHAVILLTQSMGELQPGLSTLTTAELSELEEHVAQKCLELAYILTPGGQHAFDDLPNATQINQLLSRAFILGMKAENWTNHGITVLCRTNPRYPPRVLEKLSNDAPPVLYCIGETQHLSNVRIAISMPWEVPPDFTKYASQIGQGVQKLNATVATGADSAHERALLAAAAGPASQTVGIVRSQLLETANQKQHRQAISRERLLLVSAHTPESQEQPTEADHATAKALIHTLAGRTMLVHHGDPHDWLWTDIIPEMAPEASQPDIEYSGQLYDRPRN